MYILCFIICVFVSSCSQILLKRGADKNYIGLKVFLNKYVIIGYMLFLFVTLGTVILYRYIELSAGALIEALSYIFVPVLSAVILKERISKHMFAGIALIICGIVVYAVWGGI